MRNFGEIYNMCRIFLSTPGFIKDNTKDIMPLLRNLEKTQGGHGNGVASIGSKGVMIEKGLNTGIKQANRFLQKQARMKSTEYLMFHTRIATNGKIMDYNCQPFHVNDVVLAHNGTIYELSGSEDFSDSCIAATCIGAFNLPITILKRWGGAFLGTYKGIPFCVKSLWSDMQLALNVNNFENWALCSSFDSVGLTKDYLITDVPDVVWLGTDVNALFDACCNYNWNKWEHKTVKWYKDDSGWPDIPETTTYHTNK